MAISFLCFSKSYTCQGLLVYGRQGREISRRNLDLNVCKEVCAFARGHLSSLSLVYSLIHLVLSNQDFYTMLFHSKQHVIQHLSFIHYSYIINQSLWIKINIIALQNVVIYSGVNYGCKSYVSRVNLLVLLFFKIKMT